MRDDAKFILVLSITLDLLGFDETSLPFSGLLSIILCAVLVESEKLIGETCVKGAGIISMCFG